MLAEDITTVLALLDERRTNVRMQRTRLVNQLRAVFRDLLPGGAQKISPPPSPLGCWPVGPVEAARRQLGRDLIVEIRQADQRLKVLTAQIAEAVAATGQPLDQGRRYRPGRLRAAVGTRQN